MKEQEVTIHTECIRLDALLKLSSLVMTGGEAKNAIQGGEVFLSGQPCLLRGKKIRAGDVVTYRDCRVAVKGDAS